MAANCVYRLTSFIYRRRSLSLVFLASFFVISIGLMYGLHNSPLSRWDQISTSRGAPPLYPYSSVQAKPPLTSGVIEEETRKARERFAENGVELVQENKLGYFRFSHQNISREGFKESVLDNQLNENGKSEEETKNNDVNVNKEIIINKLSSSHSSPKSHTIKKLNQTTQESKYVLLVILVISKPCNVLLRQAARKTWARDAHYFNVLVRFVVGRFEGWDAIVDRETTMHSDMIVMEEDDSYETLPNKVLAGFRWTLDHASKQPFFVMKTDDDTFINLPYLVAELLSPSFNSTQIMGAICINSPAVRDSRDKWAVSQLDFPFSTYPPYAFGGGYVMSAKCAKSLLEASSNLEEWIHLEDVYITGILARKSGISLVSHPGFAYWTSGKAKPCDFLQHRRITSVNHTEQEIFTLYEGIQDILRSGEITMNCDKSFVNGTRTFKIG